MGHGEGKRNEGGSVVVLLSILVLIVGIVAAAGLVMSVLNYTRSMGNGAPININVQGAGSDEGNENGNGEYGDSDDGGYGFSTESSLGMHYDTRIWTIQASGDGYRRVSYIDRKNRQLKGYLTDVINAVCLIAGKNCQLVHDHWQNCWSNSLPAQGLLGRHYDACSLWGTSLDRQRSYKFSEDYTPVAQPVFLTLPGNPGNFDPDNLGGKKIGFLGGWWSDRFCLLYSSDIDIEDDQIFVYEKASELLEALSDGDVDTAFVSNEFPFVKDASYAVAKELQPCLQGGDAMMMRKDSLFKEWWDPAFKKLITSRTYRGICSDIEDPAAHGNLPGRTAKEICIDY